MRTLLVAGFVAVAATFSFAIPDQGSEGVGVAAEQAPSEFQGRPAEWWAHRATHWKRRTLAHRQANRQRLQLGATGVARGLLCIHQFEGSWTDPNPPFWGGLQMDAHFQRAYGGPFLQALGTADRWPPFLQVAVGMRAYYSGRGFGPWPNTRRMCGL
jgi:hypothetical protein